MPLLASRNPDATQVSAGSISRAYGLTVLVALIVLVLFRHLFGSIRVEGGVR
jgi:hypothetical protein